MFCGCGGSISRLAKAAGAEPAGQRRDAKVHTPSTCGSQNAQSHHVWATFGSCDVPQCGKSARACGAKHMWKSKCTITPCLDHLWKLRCGKSARACGTKHLEVKMCKAWDVEQVHGVVARSTFESENVQNTTSLGLKSTSRFQMSSWFLKSARLRVAKHICKSKVLKTLGFGLFWCVRCRCFDR